MNNQEFIVARPMGDYFLSDYVWPITHRCHKREFLLKFARDQRWWLQWVFRAKKRFGVSILNYSVTSNHFHLIMKDAKGRDAMPEKKIQATLARVWGEDEPAAAEA